MKNTAKHLSRTPEQRILNPGPTVDFWDMVWRKINKSDKPEYVYDSQGNVYEIPPKGIRYLPKQVEFFEAMFEYDAVLYGGAVGGGKSYGLRWALIYFLLVCSALGLREVVVGLFCKSFRDLQDRQITPSRREFPAWLGTFNKAEYNFTFFPEYGGHIILYRNLDEPDKYASVEFAAAAFDELTKITREIFNEILHRVRWEGMRHCPIIAATNPGSIGHGWVKKDFVDKTSPWSNAGNVDEETGEVSKGYHFIQALPKDNPFLSKRYYTRLKQLDEKKYNALVRGDWSVFEGQMFPDLQDGIHFVQPFNIPQDWHRFRAADHGYRHPTVFLFGAMDFDGTLWVYDEYSVTGRTPTQHKPIVAARTIDPYDPKRESLTKFVMSVGDPRMFKGDGSVDVNKTPAEIYNRDDDEAFIEVGDKKILIGGFEMIQAPGSIGPNSRVLGWDALRDGFNYQFEEIIINGRSERRITKYPRIRIFKNCVYLRESLQNLVHKEKGDVEDAEKFTGIYGPGEGDDEADALRYLWLAVTGAPFDPEYESGPDYRNMPGVLHVPEFAEQSRASQYVLDY